MASAQVSALGPIDPKSVPISEEHLEKEKEAPWIMRKLVQVSMRMLYARRGMFRIADAIL